MGPRTQRAKIAEEVSIALWTLREGIPFVSMPVLLLSRRLSLNWQS